MSRLLRWLVVSVLLQAVALWLLSGVLDGFHLSSPRVALTLSLLLGVVEAAVWPVAYRYSARLHPAVFPVLVAVVSGALVLLAAQLERRFGRGGVHVADLWTGILVATFATGFTTVIAGLFSLNDEGGYDTFVTRALRRRYAGAPTSTEPGVMFLEIDGLAEPILRQALERGDLPTLRRWVDRGSHAITPWEPDLSSQTSASQAGILLGDNTGIPAFRWWDKPQGRLMVSSQRATAAHLEATLSTGDGLLADGGGSRFDAFSGDAPDTLGTFSTLTDRARMPSLGYVGYFLTPYTFGRCLSLFVADIARERWQAFRQRRDDVRPRVARTWKYALTRAGTTTWMLEATRFAIASDMLRGMPSAYVTIYAYDEVAHHSGIDREDAFKVLRRIDHVVAYLERIAVEAPRPYQFVVLSDHGQSMGATFLQRTGKTLAETVDDLIAEGVAVRGYLASDEASANLNAALTTVLQGEGAAGKVVRAATRKRTAAGEVHAPGEPEETAAAAASDVVVVASGNLGLVSFPKWPERLTREEVDARFPRLLPGLAAHPAVSFVMVRSGAHGSEVVGASGTRYLDEGDRVEGADPLAIFTATAADHLRRESGFANCPDVLVMGLWDPATNEDAAFEELVGNHGGLGGTQQQPFVLHPVDLDPGPLPIIGAGTLSRVLKRWVRESQPSQPRRRAPEAAAAD